MRNEEKFRTLEERGDAFNKFCRTEACASCPCNQNGIPCSFVWLSREYEEPKPDLPFIVEPGTGAIHIRDANTGAGIFMYDPNEASVAQSKCARLNDIAIAWHERMKKEGR